MKMPAPPPPLNELFDKLKGDPERLLKALTMSTQASNGTYLPWDKIRYKKPPDDLTHEEWWLSIRMARTASGRPLPALIDKTRNPFTYSIPDDVLRLTEEISRRASGNIALPEQVTSPSMRDRYIVNSLIEEAITSSQLEGAATTRQVAKEMIRSGREPMDRGERMILNNYHAMGRVRELRDEDFSPELVCEIHRIVTVDTLDDPSSAGELQRDPDPAARVAVYGDGHQVLHVPPPVEELPDRLERLCAFANGATGNNSWVQPVLRSLAVHFMAGYDHYFEDGNGRTARALFYWSMLKQGYWLTEFLTISRILKMAPAKYARSFILTEQDGGDLTYFFLYHLNVIRRAIDDLDSYLARKVRELRETRVLLAATPGEYNHRQLALLELAIREPSRVFTARSHGRSHNVSTETARHDLIDLESRGLLARTKIGRQYVWSPAGHLPAKIRESQY